MKRSLKKQKLPKLDDIKQELARRSFSEFIRYVDPGYMFAPHLKLIIDKLERVERGEIKRLMVFIPPQHGKSETISRKFPTWYFGRDPRRKVIETSYSADLSYDFSRASRSLFREYGPSLWDLTLDPESAAVNQWGLAKILPDESLEKCRGTYTASGVAGAITGKGADLAIIDDPFKDAKEAWSPTIRERVWNWYTTTLSTRLSENGTIILVMTRWHEDDLAGRLIDKANKGEGDQWDILSLPAIAEENDPLKRKPGAALWPWKYSEKYLEKRKIAVGSYVWNALYQQHPSADQGSVFKREWFRYYERQKIQDIDYYILHTPQGDKRIEISKCWILQTCDPAATENQKSDYFALGTWAVTPDKDILLLDMVHVKAETTKHLDLLKSAYYKWHPLIQGVENKTFGLTIIQNAKRLGLPIKALKADQDKSARALPMSAKYENGTVYHPIPGNAMWIGEYEDELAAFPTGPHDDQVDVASYAGILVGVGSGDAESGNIDL